MQAILVQALVTISVLVRANISNLFIQNYIHQNISIMILTNNPYHLNSKGRHDIAAQLYILLKRNDCGFKPPSGD